MIIASAAGGGWSEELDGRVRATIERDYPLTVENAEAISIYRGIETLGFEMMSAYNQIPMGLTQDEANLFIARILIIREFLDWYKSFLMKPVIDNAEPSKSNRF